MNKNKSLAESVDYPDFVKDLVQQKLAQQDLKVSDELFLYVAQDIEDYILDAGKTVAELDEVELMHIDKFINDRVAEAKGILDQDILPRGA